MVLKTALLKMAKIRIHYNPPLQTLPDRPAARITHPMVPATATAAPVGS